MAIGGPLVRPRERLIFNAMRREQKLKGLAKKMNKRYRSWAQHRVRQYWLPSHTSLTTDPKLMDGSYLAACVQKAASHRRHDLQLWKGFGQRALELRDILTPQELGYIFYGFGKSDYPEPSFLLELLPAVEGILPAFYSHPLMTVSWAMYKLKLSHRNFLHKLQGTVMEKFHAMRPADVIKINNAIARLGCLSVPYREFVNLHFEEQLESIFAQQFRNVVSDISIIDLYGPQLQKYILERFWRYTNPPALPTTFRHPRLLLLQANAPYIKM
eukprot:GHVT01039355.1.p1 GENE.GHVT01039355.1~~GHVT01039355.1.p1  ORF type:complete len:271 (+),score=18.92 GHVT01039355.1:1065-1877(+)